jgi:hypothetical protein
MLLFLTALKAIAAQRGRTSVLVLEALRREAGERPEVPDKVGLVEVPVSAASLAQSTRLSRTKLVSTRSVHGAAE